MQNMFFFKGLEGLGISILRKILTESYRPRVGGFTISDVFLQITTCFTGAQ